MLNDRRRNILTALVREYVRSAHPVGSKALVDQYRLDCSPATVRNDLAALEESGHVFQPHVSAGRVPTDDGYREFVDALGDDAGTTTPTPDEVESVRGRLREVETELSDLMRETASLLTRLTNYAAVVLAPTLRRSRVARIDLVPLGADRVLVVLITDTGQVVNRTAETGQPVGVDDIAAMEGTLNRALDGRRADEVREATGELIQSVPNAQVWLAVIDELFALLTDADETSVYQGGAKSLLDEPEFEDPEMVRSIVGLLEDGLLLSQTFTEANRASDVFVRIGQENSLVDLAQMSIVLAPYGPDGDGGYLGLVGPTRMDYARAIRSVRCVARSLNDAFEPGRG